MTSTGMYKRFSINPETINQIAFILAGAILLLSGFAVGAFV